MPARGAGVAYVREEKRYITVKCNNDEYVLDRAAGMLCSWKKNGRETLQRPCDLLIWRAMTDNDRFIKEKWLNEYFDKTYFKRKEISTEYTKNGYKISVSGTIGADGRLPVYYTDVNYLFNQDGLNIKIHAKKNDSLKSIAHVATEENGEDIHLKADINQTPRFAVRFPVKSEFNSIEYFGKGGGECYSDYCAYVRGGIWKSSPHEEYQPYIMPQECGNHIDVRWVDITNGADTLSFIGKNRFEFSALPYTVEELDRAGHSFELCESDATEVIINYKNRGIGSNSCGPELSEKYCVTDKIIDFEFVLN